MSQIPLGESNHSSKTSKKRGISLLDLVLFLLVFTGPPTFRRGDFTSSLRGDFDTAVLVQVAVWVCAFVWLALHLLGKRRSHERMAVPVKLGITLATVFALSSFFSPSPPLTLFRSFQLLAIIGFSILLVNKYGWQQILNFVLLGLSLLLVGMYGAFLWEPELVMPDDNALRLRGDVLGPSAPLALSMMAITLINPLRLKFASRTMLFLLAFAILVLSRTRMGFVTLGIIGLLSILTLGKRWSPIKIFLPMGALLVLFPLFVGWDAIEAWVLRDPRQLDSLSGRIPLWAYLILQTIHKNFFLGLGYVSACRVMGPEGGSALGNAHNAFIEAFVGGGLVALILYLAIWFWIGAKALNKARRMDEFDFSFLSLFTIVFFISLTTSHSILISFVNFIFWLVIVAWHDKTRHNTHSVVV
jgi:O-antigen ligase